MPDRPTEPVDNPERPGSGPVNYRASGVDLDAYEQTMSRLLRRTYNSPRVMDWPGGFAGLFRLNANIGLLSRRAEKGTGRRSPGGGSAVGARIEREAEKGTFLIVDN